MNLLIVDDEYYYAEGLKGLLDWGQLGFEQILCAYSMQQAQEFFQSYQIDLMISDIEMPKGSGLDLLEWVNARGYKTVTVFLTAYANFSYASTAIKLQIADYLLKPIDQQSLHDCVTKAIQKIRQQQIEATYKEKEDSAHKLKLAEQFWNSLCTQVLINNAGQIQRTLKQYAMPSSLSEEAFYIGLLQAYIKNEDERWEINLYEYAIRNVVTEAMEPSECLQILTRLNDEHYLLCLKASRISQRAQYIKLCHLILRSLKISLPGVFKLYAGQCTTLEQAGKTFRDLIKLAHNDIYDQHQVIDSLLPPKLKTDSSPISMNDWTDLFLQRRTKEVYEQAQLYLSELQRTRSADRSDLIKFKHNFMQIIYSILEKKGESANRLFSDSAAENVLEQSCDSIDEMKKWVAHVIRIFGSCLQMIDQSESCIEVIKRYVIAHIDEDLSRKTLANLVYLSPDYLSHVFREQTGESLSAFIQAERIRKSKELLLTTGLNIRDIALQSGFPSLSYFSRQFKSATGSTPQEFRKIINK